MEFRRVLFRSVESEIINFGYTIYGWRQVPVDMSVIGDKAMMTRPEIEQIMIAGPLPDESSRAEFEKTLYLIRRRIEKKFIEAQIQGFYVCSPSKLGRAAGREEGWQYVLIPGV